jgi:hypothetical protein
VTTPDSTDDRGRLQRRGPTRPTTTTTLPAGHGERLAAGTRLRPAGPGLVEQLRQALVYVETAAVLERRACRADNPALAALLRERADVRRRMASRLRAALVEQSSRPPSEWERP